ncbi:MAG TPA: hypothetical protein VGA69_00700 [Nitriliruptorales bacterium]
MSLTDVTTDVHERLEPARERVTEQLEAGRARVEEVAHRAQEAAAPRVEQARRAARPAAMRVKDAAVDGAGLVAGLVADMVPSILERIVAVLRALFGDLEEKGRELAHQIEPPRSVSRRRRLRFVVWFAGGFAVGAGAGWYAHQRYADQGIEAAQDPASHARDVAGAAAAYGEDAASIDARREDVSFN